MIMAQNITHYISVLCLLICFSFISHSQVGINTTSPEGVLDVNSATSGIVFPRVALTARNVAAPVVNPKTGGAPVNGTYVFNTTTTSTGTNDVYPGLYVWYNNEWVAQYQKSDSRVFEQNINRTTDPFGLRTTNGENSIPGLTNENFVPKYSGRYKIEISTNYGGGYVNVPANRNTGNSPTVVNHVHPYNTGLNTFSQEGTFTFSINGANYDLYANSYSAYNNGTNYFAVWQQTSLVLYIDLIAGNTYNISLSFVQNSNANIQNNGNSGDGRGFIGVHVPCYAEFNFISD